MKKIIYILSLVLFFGCASTSTAQNYKTHKVKSGETIESIAKKYQVTSFDIYQLNPDAKGNLRTNSVLIIPKPKVISSSSSSSEYEEIKEISGFKKHKVRRKETLYSLSKKYNVSQEDLKKHNKRLYSESLRKGDRIQIPVFKTKRVLVESKPTSKPYTVKAKEGKWRIAYKFGITTQELQALNPNMADVLKEGQIINVPNLETDDQKPIDDRYSYYTVLPKEGFYRLKVKLGLEQDDLEKLNPGLKETGLKEGMVLKIPYNFKIRAENSGIELTEGEIANGTLSSSDLSTQIKNRSTKHIVVMLPFKTHRVNTDSIYDAKRFINNDRYAGVALDFHSGVLVALDSLKEMGISMDVDVYDTKKELSEVSRLVRSNDFSDVDAVIGPLDAKLFNQVASDLKSQSIPVISPLTKKVDLRDNVFQTRPSESLLKDKIINYIKNDSLKAHVIVISDSKHQTISSTLKLKFPEATLVNSRKDSKTNKDEYYIHDLDVMDKLKPGRNYVFLETKNQGFASNVTSILNALISPEKQIILTTTGMNSAFEGEEVSNYHLSNLKFLFPTIAKMYNDDDNSFSKRYKAIYNETPNKIAVRGFDLTMDVVLRLSSSKNLYTSVNEIPLTSYVENKFSYKKKLFGGYFNESVYLVRYDDLKIVEVLD